MLEMTILFLKQLICWSVTEAQVCNSWRDAHEVEFLTQETSTASLILQVARYAR